MGLAVAHNNVLLSFGSNLTAITNLSWSGINREMIEVDAVDITDGWKTFLKGHKDGGEVTVTCNYIPDNATHNSSTGLLEDLSDDTTDLSFTLTLPDAAGSMTHTFSGAVSGVTITANNGEVLTIEFTIKLTGKPTFNAS
jgi:hypothetical protein